MADLTDDLRISDETPESIKARLLADTNAGIDPNDPSYADTVPGSFWDDLEGANCLELDRVYDRLDQVVAAAVPSLSYGAFLDAWGASLGRPRKDAAAAGGKQTFAGAAGTIIAAGTQVSTAQTTADALPVTFQTTAGGTIPGGGALVLDVTAVDLGSAGNVPANTVTILDTPLSDPAVTVTNTLAMTSGADVETDASLQTAILRKLSAAGGGGNQADYIDWALAYPGVGFVTVQPNTPTVGHVTVVITDINNDPMTTAAVNGLQAVLDPSATPTQGAGQAPVGATVHVSTPTAKAVAASATPVFETGYSLDGAGGTRALRADITVSLSRYVDGLPVGGDVVYNKALAAIVDVVGVADVSALSLNGGAAGAGVVVAATEVASLTVPITLT